MRLLRRGAAFAAQRSRDRAGVIARLLAVAPARAALRLARGQWRKQPAEH